jgi:large subunit ribosomal protein L25
LRQAGRGKPLFGVDYEICRFYAHAAGHGCEPGIVYGGTGEPLLIEIDHNALFHAIKKEAFHAAILGMELNGTEHKVLLRDLQMHPFKQQVLHIDFQRVEARTRMTV